MRQKLTILAIFVLALTLRLYGLNWDQGQHLHPDERFLTMVANDTKLPSTFVQYFNNSQSPLNPYNYPNYQFFVYGTFPLFLTKTFAVILHLDNYQGIVLVGRALSAVFDSLNILLIYFLALKVITKNKKLIFLPSLIYALCVLPLQLSHFFAVDTFLNTFLLATFTLLAYSRFPQAGIAFGFALASKISAVYFAPIIALFFVFHLLKNKNLLKTIFLGLIFCFFSFLIFRIFQPYIFDGIYKINSHFIENINTLKYFSQKDGNYPPSVQWLSVIPLPFALKNFVLWGLGLPFSFGLIILLIIKFKTLSKNQTIVLSFIWILWLYFYQGSQFNPTMRYLLPIYPFIVLLFVYLLSHLKNIIFFKILVALNFLYSLAFINIYSHRQTRVDASLWIYRNIPAQSVVTNEYWDDPLPLNVEPYNSSIYQGIMISPYDPDSVSKIDLLNSQINSANYIFMSSNRLWRSIPSSSRYPLTTKYYTSLFSGNSNFKKVLELNSYPGFSLPFLKGCYYFGPTDYPGIKNSWFSVDTQCFYPGVYLRDDTSEEAFTVYDHPKVLIFKK